MDREPIFYKNQEPNEETLGNCFRAAREEYELTIADVERETKISARYIRALESGRYNSLPAEVYTRGFVKSYALFLGLNTEFAMSLYEKEAASLREYNLMEELKKLPPPHDPDRAPRKSFPLLPVAITIIAVMTAVMGVWGFTRIFPDLSNSEGEGLAAISSLPLKTGVPERILEATPTQEQGKPVREKTFTPRGMEQYTATPTKRAIPDSIPRAESLPKRGMLLQFLALKDLRVSIYADNKLQFSGRISAGSFHQYEAEKYIRVDCSRGNALRYQINNVDQGFLSQSPGRTIKKFRL